MSDDEITALKKSLAEAHAQINANDASIRQLTASNNTNAETVRAVRAVLAAANVPTENQGRVLGTIERVQWLVDKAGAGG